jgi:riboflavin kinase/FMN adenylyltransferase
MRIIEAIGEGQSTPERVCLAIGFFDGVHLGHQQVIRQAVIDAEQTEATSVVVTFDRHPKAVIAPAHAPPLLYSLPQRLRAIASLGVEAVLVLRFDEEFSRQNGEEFVRSLAARFHRIHSVCVGAGFVFGHRRSGNVELLRALGKNLGFGVHGLAAVSLDGEPVSSTRIREAVAGGRMDFAGEMLGRGYSLAGEVVRGDQLGRQLGFPTANLEVTGRALPPPGVYAVHARVANRSHRAVFNLGIRPTLGGTPTLRAEAHLLDFHDEIYGQEMELSFVCRLRDEQKFPSLDALRQQIQSDIRAARACFETT